MPDEDCYAKSYDKGPRDGSPRVTGDCNTRDTRSGSWGDSPRDLLAAFRLAGFPEYRGNHLGFRLARTLNP